MKLWDKGITIDKKIEAFTVGDDRAIDLHIAKYDLLASIAHAEMLNQINIITTEELHLLKEGLNELLNSVTTGEFIIEASFEDVHSKIEFELINRYGDIGKKIHTARSRNDQVLVALHLYYKDAIVAIKELIIELFDTLLTLAETYKEYLLPGYTHMQVAMPSSFGLWFSAYAELLIDDLHILQAAYNIVDQNPLGSAAGYGSSFPIDRAYTTTALGFSTLKYNVVAAQMSRGKSERTIATALSSVAATVSKFAMDICLYTSQNYNFISFPDALTTGSSIMPHKKNPDVFELIRGTCNTIQALPTEMMLLTNNLPSGYHRDFQLLKKNMISGIEQLKDVLSIMNFAIAQVNVHNISLEDEKYQHLFTVDSINNLVMEGLPFRDAYKKVSTAVEAGVYEPDISKKHSHMGSIHNLCLAALQEKIKPLKITCEFS